MLDKINDEILPNALMIGVDYDLFWTLNPKSLSPFVKAFELRQKYDDTLSWKQGIYIKLAIASALDSKNKYPKKPLLYTESTDMTAEEIKERMMRQMKIINSRYRKEETHE